MRLRSGFMNVRALCGMACDKDCCHSHAVGTIFDMFFADGAYQLFRIRFMFLFAGVLCGLRYGLHRLRWMQYAGWYISG